MTADADAFATSHPEDAAASIRDALDRNDPEHAASLLLDHVWELYFENAAIVRELMDRLPERLISSRPALVIVQLFLVPMHQIGTRGFGHRLRPAFSLSTEDLGDEELEWYFVALVVMHRMRGEHDEAREVARRARPLLRRPVLQHRPSARRMLSAWFIQLGTAELLAGDGEQALRDFTEASTIQSPEANGIFTKDALVRAACVHASLGELELARECLAAAAAVETRTTSYAHHVESRIDLAHALIAVEELQPDAEALVVQSDAAFADELWPLRLLARTRWELAQGNYVGTVDRIDAALRTHDVPPRSLAARITAAQRTDAVALMGLTSPEGEDDPSFPGHRLSRIRRSLSDPSAALQASRQFVASPSVGPSLRLEALVLAAWAHDLVTGETPNTYTRTALAQVRRTGILRPLRLVPDRIGRAAGLESPHLPPAAVPEPTSLETLTRRERDVLRELAAPGTIAQIAERLHVSVNTVKSQVRSVYRRLGAGTRDEAIRIASVRGLLDD